MGFLNKAGAALGIGSASVVVAPDGNEYSWGETVTGRLHLTGGTTDQTIAQVQVGLLEHWETTETDHDTDSTRERRVQHNKYHNLDVLAMQVIVAAGSRQELPFGVTVPQGAALDHEWYVEARLDLPRAKDQRGRAPIQLILPRWLLRLEAALWQVAPFERSGISQSGTRISLSYGAPGALKDKIDGVALWVEESGGNVAGELEVNLQEKSLKDHLKALLRKDRVRYPVTFPLAHLSADPDDPPPAEVAEKLREIVEPHLR